MGSACTPTRPGRWTGSGKAKHLILTTPTASGKTLAFTLPVLERQLTDPDATALFLYPTKALANDQLKAIRELAEGMGIAADPAIYDGDPPASRRPRIRDNSRIILSNPHELHQVLPWHHRWTWFLSHLQVVVIDEAHRYRGVLGRVPCNRDSGSALCFCGGSMLSQMCSNS